jgi:hypothetical protein
MVVRHIRESTNFLFNVVSGSCCSEYLATAVYVEEVDKLLTVSMVECVLTKGEHFVTHSAITVPI